MQWIAKRNPLQKAAIQNQVHLKVLNQVAVGVDVSKMFYSVKFTFFDEKLITVNVSPKEIQRFIECIGKGDVYWDPVGEGFWLCAEKIRYMEIKKNSSQPEKEFISD